MINKKMKMKKCFIARPPKYVIDFKIVDYLNIKFGKYFDKVNRLSKKSYD